MTSRPARDGFTMITVLWVMTVAGMMATAAAITGRNTVNAARNRVQLERAYWIATGCGARAQSAIDATLGAAESYEDAGGTWRILSHAVDPLALPAPSECATSLEAAGTRLDVNSAPVDVLERLFAAIGSTEATAAALAAALADWRDTDDVVRPDGAERDWYASARRPLPRNGPFADIGELALVRGFENVAQFETVLSVDVGRVCLATASVPVLLSVPGFMAETAERIAALNAEGIPVRDVLSLTGMISAASAEALLERYSEVIQMTTPDPDAWILTIHADVGLPRAGVTLTRRLVRAGKRAVVVGSGARYE